MYTPVSELVKKKKINVYKINKIVFDAYKTKRFIYNIIFVR